MVIGCDFSAGTMMAAVGVDVVCAKAQTAPHRMSNKILMWINYREIGSRKGARFKQRRKGRIKDFDLNFAPLRELCAFA
jgi:hypothetical protein